MPVAGIYTALSGMNAHRQILDTTAHNVANQITPGYRRQVVDLAPLSIGTSSQVFAGPGSGVMGVEVQDARRVLNEMAEFRARTNVAGALDASVGHEALLNIETIFAEPSERGLANTLDAFWVSWSDLADRAADPVARTEVLGRAGELVDRLRSVGNDLDTMDADAQRRLGAMETEVNSLAAQVADLNQAIAASSSTPNELLDQRDMLADKLATLVGARIRPTERGQIAVTVGGRLLVGNGSAYGVRAANGSLAWSVDDSPLAPGPGELAAINRLRTETIPTVRAGLDDIVEQLVTEVNDLHRVGFGLDGTDGRDFFDPTGITLATVAISSDVDGLPDHLAAGAPVLPGPTAPGLHDGDQAQLIGDLVADGTATDSYRSWIAQLGLQTNAAGRHAETTQQIANRTLDEAESISGVSLDEELTMMMAAQQGYEASARVLRTVDEMLQTLMGMV